MRNKLKTTFNGSFSENALRACVIIVGLVLIYLGIKLKNKPALAIILAYETLP